MTKRLNKLKEYKSKTCVKFLRFTRIYKRDIYERDNPSLFCFFEGEDSIYYTVRIKNITGYNRFHDFKCEGKESVLKIYNLLSKREYYQNPKYAKFAYFIDKDFDESIHESSDIEDPKNIFETPYYSIENFYTSIECFREIVIDMFKIEEFNEYGEYNENFKICLDKYQNRQKEFHEKTKLLNTYIAYLRKENARPNIKDIKLITKKNSKMSVTLDSVDSLWTFDTITKKIPIKNPPQNPFFEEKVEQKLKEYKMEDPRKSFRGKFEIEFLVKFLQALKKEAEKDIHEQEYFSRKFTISFNFDSTETILSQLSQYAETPDCLVEYLEQFKENVNMNQ